MSGREGQTIGRIRRALGDGSLVEPFRAADVNRALGIDWADVFLPKHCVGTGSSTGLFKRVDRGVYRVNR